MNRHGDFVPQRQSAEERENEGWLEFIEREREICVFLCIFLFFFLISVFVFSFLRNERPAIG